jgi:HAD superfamily hydrolase (TIGR01490 family)
MDKPVIAIFDLDHTITRIDTYVAFLSNYIVNNPLKGLNMCWLPLAVLMHKLGLRDNTWLKVTFLRSIAGGATKHDIEYGVEHFVTRLINNGIRPGAKLAIERHRKAGDFLLLVSASFDFYVEKIALVLGFDDIIVTKSEWDSQGRLTGRIVGSNCYGSEKLIRVISYIECYGQQPYTVAYADHYSDIPLLAWVDRAVAVNPEAALRDIALKEGFDVENWD